MIDTRDLIEERTEIQDRILDDWNEKFEDEQLDDFSEIPTETEDSDVAMFLEYWEYELKEIEEINDLEDEVNSYAGDSFDDGVYLINVDDFEDFVEQDLEDLGYIPKDFPTWIEIDWKATANNVQQDYIEVTFRGTDYLFR